MSDAATVLTGSWRELLGREHLRTATVLASGVGLYATNEFLTISLLPSAVADIGGQRFYAWVTTVYLVGSVAAATTVSPLLIRWGPRLSYLMTFFLFGAGSVGCALAPSMEILLVARTVQGVAGGLLAGLGYAVINAALPGRLWTRASALVSAMWGVSTLLGPAAGGLFAQFGIWRWAFGSLAVMTAATATLVPGALPHGRASSGALATSRIPMRSLILLGAAALAVSVAGIQRTATATAGLLAASVGLVGCFLVVDRRVRVAVLPRAAFGPGPLKWMYVTIGLLMAATMVDMYVPLFGQRLAHLVPVAAGFLGAVLAVGWTLSEILSASLRRRRVVARLVAVAPLVVAIGLALAAATLRTNPMWSVIAAWAAALFIVGAGVGIAWPHLSAWIMGAVEDPVEAGAAAAAINTVQLISGAFGAGLAGVVVNSAEGGDVASARWLFAVFAVLAILGGFASFRSRPTQ
ncbi:MFS transporter [Mycobacterium sp.]|uniref:MFS transporter n=1 Tax=Mycobacterium sp. TaxID=1785 RepID=UPI002CE336A6|nr:MFS transporter [Mycobacterium sp.]HME49705.1 MFS transporter [Mycobacterium sp.]